MRVDLQVRAVHQGEMRVVVPIRETVLAMDYPARPGGDPTPLEMLLASLAACAGNALNLVLSRKLGVQVPSLEVEAVAQRRTEHPTVLTEIELTYRLRGEGLEPAMVERAVGIAEGLCPVLAMLRPGTEVRSSWRLD